MKVKGKGISHTRCIAVWLPQDAHSFQRLLRLPFASSVACSVVVVMYWVFITDLGDDKQTRKLPFRGF